MYFIINLNKNYYSYCIYFVTRLSIMLSELKFVFLTSHIILIVGLLFVTFQESDIVQEKVNLALIIFTTLNLIRLIQKGDKENYNDQF
ncbi:MAG: hypothetical protein RLZZ96_42 [Bacteroidota bacterium]|jgi:hypothetical protein